MKISGKFNKPLFIIFSITVLDAFGIGLIMPILPELLKSVSCGNSSHIAIHYGILTSIYALMQFLFSPLLGSLSDKFGRKPVLLVSLAGAAIDYVIMAGASTIEILYIGRIISGITGADVAAANAYIADISAEDERADNYGILGAGFGFGFIGGPVLGGLLGSLDVHLPFLLVALFSAINFVITYVFLHESNKNIGGKFDFKSALNPISSFGLAINTKGVGSLLYTYFTIQFVGQAPAVLWVIFCAGRFGWSPLIVGISLAGYGIMHAICQALITGPLCKKFGSATTVVIGILLDASAYVFFAITTNSYIAALIIVLFAAGSIGTPALQAILSNQVEQERQGNLQGVISALNSLTSVVGPVVFSFVYSITQGIWDGWVWVLGAAIYVTCVPSIVEMFRMDRKKNLHSTNP